MNIIDILTRHYKKIKDYISSQLSTVNDTIESKASASDLTNYLPKSGGQLTGSIISRNVNDEFISLHSGQTAQDGARLDLIGKDYENWEGYFSLTASNGTETVDLVGTPKGLLTWSGTDFTCPNGNLGTSTNKWKTLYATSIFGGANNIDCSVDSQGDDWIRYSSGLQICWGNVKNEATGTNAYPKPFKANSYVIIIGSYIGTSTQILNFYNVDGTNFSFVKASGDWAAWHAIGKWK